MFSHAYRTRAFAMSLLVLPGLGFMQAGTAFAANPAHNSQSGISPSEGTSGVESQGRRQAQQGTSGDSQNRRMTQEVAPDTDDATGRQTGEHHGQHHRHHGQAQGEQVFPNQGAETAGKGAGAGKSATSY
jgi:hypothetical protein